ncbi:MAG: antibiotic biosynthesis monooxygenase [Gemmatimonadaceae bacterium]
MYAVIRRYLTHPGTADRIAERVNADFVPLISRMPDFVAYYLIKGGDDTIAAVSVFENRASAEESTQLASEWVRRNVVTMIKTSPVILTGEVVAHETEGVAR